MSGRAWEKRDIGVQGGSNLPQTQLCKLKEFKGRYRDVLQDTLGRTTLVCHNIVTGNTPPMRLPPYQLAHKNQETLSEEIKALLKQDIIRPSTSPWAAPIVLVTKDSTKRMCVDYRKLNTITANDPYPLLNIEQLIANLGRSKYITTLDLSMGYHQVPVNKEHIERTAFIIPYGKCRVFDDTLWTDHSSLDIPEAYGQNFAWIA